MKRLYIKGKMLLPHTHDILREDTLSLCKVWLHPILFGPFRALFGSHATISMLMPVKFICVVIRSC